MIDADWRRIDVGATLRRVPVALLHDAVMADREDVTITLTSDEALVLFDLLHRWEDDEQVLTPQHQAEQVALWNFSALLERVLREPFSADYVQLVAGARERLGTSR